MGITGQQDLSGKWTLKWHVCIYVFMSVVQNTTSKNALYHNWLSQLDITPSTAYGG